jgi:hypothetical protein
MCCLGRAARIVTDPVVRLALALDQSAPWNTIVWTAGVPQALFLERSPTKVG